MTLTPIPRCHGLVMELVSPLSLYTCLICGTRAREGADGVFRAVDDETPAFNFIGPKRSRFLHSLVQLDAQIQAEENQP